MSNEINELKKESNSPTVTELAIVRNRLAAERTLMAWIRTSLAMISFGFTIYKFMQFVQGQPDVVLVNEHTPRRVGLSLIGLGTFALVIACFQHFRYIKRLNYEKQYKFWFDLSLQVAFLLGLLGLLMFGSIIIRSGPFH